MRHIPQFSYFTNTSVQAPFIYIFTFSSSSSSFNFFWQMQTLPEHTFSCYLARSIWTYCIQQHKQCKNKQRGNHRRWVLNSQDIYETHCCNISLDSSCVCFRFLSHISFIHSAYNLLFSNCSSESSF